MVTRNNCDRVHVKQIDFLQFTGSVFREMPCKCSLMLCFAQKLEEHSQTYF